ncbi:MAG TPA: diacylglycerol kinase family protein [Thermoanaerobaculia bacterium]|nr:diacylglycerol kinase family protein [Thermoanaerobaculia bacterium]
MKARIIVNPNAGSVEGVAALRASLGRLPGTEICITDREGHAEDLARQAVEEDAELVVAAGGDGTLNEVLNGLSSGFERTRLGLLPLGTGNDFARSIGVPDDLEGALAVLLAGRFQRIDVGRAAVGGKSRCFLNMAVGGFSGVVSEKASDAKERWGPLAYMRGAVDALPELQAFETTIVLNGAERLRIDTYNIVISNGRYVAAGIPVAPQAVLDDGLFEVMIAPATTLPKLALLVPQVLLGQHLESDLLLFRRATRVEIESDPSMAFNVDGEILGEESSVFEVQPRAVEMVVGPDAAA